MDPERDLWSEPPDLPRRPPWASAGTAAVLAVVLVALTVAVVILPTGGLLAQISRLGWLGGSASPSLAAPSLLAEASIGPSPSPTFVRPTPTPLPSFLAYVVRKGDNLTSIARRFSTTPRSIAFWNRTAYPSLDPESRAYKPGLIQVGWTLLLIPGAVFDEDDQPSPSPSAAVTTASPDPPAGTPSPLPITFGPSVVVTHGPRGTDRVALTFDMEARLDSAAGIMDLLVERGVHATIFSTGELGTETDRGRRTLTIVRAHPELFDLGSHSWDHPDFTTLTPSQIRDQLDRTESALVGLTGRSSRPLFRPPYGAWNSTVRSVVGGGGWHYIVTWDINTGDLQSPSRGGPNAADIQATVLANAQGGSIVLMHLGGYRTLEALPGILDGLAARGLRPVTLTEMLGN
jgi:peptidoglycan/xylan/chitin deacetylase (PgdA/CDA1 family)